MYPYSAQFARALRQGGVVVRRADVYQGNNLVYPGLPVAGGSVQVDGTAATRRRVDDLLVVDPTGALTPAQAGDLLTPYGNEVRVYWGFAASTLGTAEDEMVPLGVFRFNDTEVEETEQGRVTRLSGYDRSLTISTARLTDVYIIGAGQNYATAIADFLDFILPGVTGDRSTFATTSEVTPLLVFTEDADPWERQMSMAASVGMDLYIGVNGVPVLAPVVDPLGASPLVTYSGDSPPSGTTLPLLQVGKGYSTDPGYNGVVVFGESNAAAAPVRGVAWDTNPDSPTYYLGPYGQRPKIEYSEFAVTQAAADAQAAASLVRSAGGTEQVRASLVPHPLHEAGDPVRVLRSEIHLDEINAVESFEIPLGVTSPMPMVLRRRRSVAG